MNIDNSSMTASRNTTSSIGVSNGIFEAAKTRWLTVEEIITLLSNAYESEEHESNHGVPSPNPIIRRSISPPRSPPSSGTIFLYDRVAVRNYKVDGHDWIRKRSNPAKIREDHVKLRYKGTYRVGGNYVHSADVDTLHRRVYRLLETDEEKARPTSSSSSERKALVLVHYLDTNEAANLVAMKQGGGDFSSSTGDRSSIGNGGGKRIWQSSDDDDGVSRQYQKRIHTANSYTEVMNAPSQHHYYGNHSHGRHQHGSDYYEQQQAVAWSPHATMAGASASAHARSRSRSSTGTGVGHAVSSEAAHLDRVNFEQLWGSVESDTALARGLDQLLEADAAVKVYSRRGGESSSVDPRLKK